MTSEVVEQKKELQLVMIAEAIDGIISEVTPLDRLRAANELVVWAQRMLQSTVDEARNEHTWAEIGEALGVTRQAVQSRFSR